MDQPEGVIKLGTENLVCLLKKSLYGLRQSPRQWYKQFDEFMLGIKFIRCSYDSCVYLKMKKDQVVVYLLLYVDDMLIASKSVQDIQELKQKLNSEFEMKDLGEAKRILGMAIVRDRKNKKLFLTQSSYLKKVVQKFNMHQAKEVSIPLGQHFKLFADQSPSTPEEANDMATIPY